jgi:predicted nucleic acid-binding protein
VMPVFGRRGIPVSVEVAELSGDLAAVRTRGLADTLIAATALVHGLTLVTRNTADFDDDGLRVLNPWSA